MSLKQFGRSVKDAVRGIFYVFRNEPNFRIQIIIAIIVLGAAFYFPLRNYERVTIILLIALVLILELANSILERIIDLFQPKIDYVAKIIKDILAGAVLVAAISSVAVGYIIFMPYISQFLISNF